MDLTLTSPVQYVPGVGPVMAERLVKLGISTVTDLLYHAPFRYDDYSLVSKIANIQPGEVVTIHGTIDWIRSVMTKKGKKMQQAEVSDETGKAMVVWFNQPFLANILHKNTEVRLAGEVSWFGRQIALVSPTYETIGTQAGVPSLHTGRLVPIYPETEGLSSKWLRSRVAFALEHVLPQLQDPLSDEFRTSNALVDIGTSIQTIHFPKTNADLQKARFRLAFEELFTIQLAAKQAKNLWISSQHAYQMNIGKTDISKFVQSLPFDLTADQQKAVSDLTGDVSRTYPANRLLEGDVGAGKTVVAAAAMYIAKLNSLQSVLMAPTEILASQHYETLTRLLGPHDISVALVTGSHKPAEFVPSKIQTPQEQMFTLPHKHYDVYVGTHALLSQPFFTKSIGLVVIDEQQRFGVKQRKILRSKNQEGNAPHLLTMTATPIPRTIALTVFGNIDVSVLHTMPTGRKKVKTWVVAKNKREDAYRWIIKHVNQSGGQVFILCPLVEESESLITAKAATVEYTHLKKGALRSLRLGLLHGRMNGDEKRKILQDFREKKFDVLVATPVVEVGIDIPGASVMMVEAADRFGLGQLHQLRGRVGRNSKDAYCFLFTDSTEERVHTRLKALETTFSGPELAELDLKLRGPGEIFGTKQHGIPLLKFANFTDTALISQTAKAATKLLDADPGLVSHPLLRENVRHATIGESSQD